MLPLAIVVGIFALAAFMGLLARSLNEKHQAFKLLCFGTMLFFLIFGAYQIALLPTVEEVKLNYTVEDSLYWNCSQLIYECWGTPYEEACDVYNETQCLDIANCTWSGSPNYTCSGTPSVSCDWLGAYDVSGDKCEETSGCYWDQEVELQLCDQVNVSYHYGNYSTGYEAFGDAFEGVAFVLMVIVIILFGYFFLMFLISALNNFGKKPNMGEEDDYDKPY